MRAEITWRGVAGGVITLIVVVVCVRLGIWQLDRLEERRARNAAYAAALALPPLELAGDTLEAVRHRPDEFVYRRARVPGAARADGLVVWRGRSLDGRPGVNVLTPYSAHSVAVIVNRGWAPSPDAAHIDAGELAPPARDPVGVLVPLPTGGDRAHPARLESGGVTVRSVQVPDPAVLGELLGTDVLPLYLQQTDAPAGYDFPTPLPRPNLDDEGPHLGYAFQWFSFAAIALVGFGAAVALRTRSLRG